MEDWIEERDMRFQGHVHYVINYVIYASANFVQNIVWLFQL